MRPSLPQKKCVCGSAGSGGGGLWVSNCLLVWSILTSVMVMVCLINRFVFQPRGCIPTSHQICGYCRLKVF